MKDKYRRRLITKPAAPSHGTVSRGAAIGYERQRTFGKSLAVTSAIRGGGGMGLSGAGHLPSKKGVGNMVVPSTLGPPSYANMWGDLAKIEERLVHDMVLKDPAKELHRPGWLYSGAPSLCRKCARVWAAGCKCLRDAGHVCELESVASAEERRLGEVHRRLKADFGDPPDTAEWEKHTAEATNKYWQQLVGLATDRN